jgi:hypothetical protein
MKHHNHFPLREARDRAARANGTTVYNDTHLAARQKTAAASRGETLVPPAGSASSAVTLTAALQRTLVHLNHCISSSAVPRAALLKRSLKGLS